MIPDHFTRDSENGGVIESENGPSKRDSRGRLLRIDIRPMEAAEAESLRLQAEVDGWIVMPEIEQRQGHRPCAYGWQFWLKVPLHERWHWTHVMNHYWFVFWTTGPNTIGDDERKRRARELAQAWQDQQPRQVVTNG